MNANGTAGHWWLDYGTTTTYGSKTAPVASGPQRTTWTLGSPSPASLGTLYHVRFVISNTIGTTPGDDLTFTTLGAPGANGNPVVGTGGKKICRVPKVIGKKLNPARRKMLAAGCKVKVVYKKSKRPKGMVLKQSRKPGKKLVYHAVVKLTVAVKHQPKVAKHKPTS